MRELGTQCCIAGGGPAGMMLGYLLARAGVSVTVLEKHADFFRDFRGDTVHPSTMTVMNELGLLGDFLKIPHSRITQLGGIVNGEMIRIADFSHVPGPCQFLAIMPQWDFLNFLAERAQAFPHFQLLMQTEATNLTQDDERITGVEARTTGGPLRVSAPLIIGADGRHSVLRNSARLPVQDFGAPMDVLWFRLSRKDTDPDETFGYAVPGAFFIAIRRPDYFQCGFVIRKGTFETLRSRGLPAFRDQICLTAPFLCDRTGELRSWDDVRLLTVMVDRLSQWAKPGLLCIGDAAHAMSPIGGVGINLAIQDAVAAANLLAVPLREGRASIEDLRRVQRRREFPTRMTQAAQIAIQRRIITGLLQARNRLHVARWLYAFNKFPLLRRIPAYLIGIGVRPEHVKTARYLRS